MRPLVPYLFALGAVAAVAWLTASLLPVLGLSSSALLFLLPVLFASARGGTGPGLVAALAGAAAYNFLLLPPRFTFHVQGFDNVISVFVLVAVALVTSRLATRLKEGRAEALARARASEEAAELAAVLGRGELKAGLADGTAWFDRRYGAVLLIATSDSLEDNGRFSSLDLSAAAWARHNGDMTGHGTPVMPAADWTFLPLAPHNRRDGRIAALARHQSGWVRDETELAHVQQLMFLLGQTWDRIELERERRVRERLEESERLRRTLVASLAHDLRTPLTVVMGRLEGLASTSAEAAEAWAAARRLDRMMENLLGAARMESGSLPTKLESLDLVDVVSAACVDAVIPPEATLERQIPSDLPFVRADATLIHHVLLNLLDNAGRHARSRITLTAMAEESAVRLVICDDGPGIPAEQRERIWERFARTEGSDRVHGSGLGLSIVKGFTDAMGIGIEIEDLPGAGTCFILNLPFAATGRRP